MQMERTGNSWHFCIARHINNERYTRKISQKSKRDWEEDKIMVVTSPNRAYLAPCLRHYAQILLRRTSDTLKTFSGHRAWRDRCVRRTGRRLVVAQAASNMGDSLDQTKVVLRSATSPNWQFGGLAQMPLRGTSPTRYTPCLTKLKRQ